MGQKEDIFFFFPFSLPVRSAPADAGGAPPRLVFPYVPHGRASFPLLEIYETRRRCPNRCSPIPFPLPLFFLALSSYFQMSDGSMDKDIIEEQRDLLFSLPTSLRRRERMKKMLDLMIRNGWKFSPFFSARVWLRAQKESLSSFFSSLEGNDRDGATIEPVPPSFFFPVPWMGKWRRKRTQSMRESLLAFPLPPPQTKGKERVFCPTFSFWFFARQIA